MRHAESVARQGCLELWGDAVELESSDGTEKATNRNIAGRLFRKIHSHKKIHPN